jgi:hypothetical protein
MDDAPCAFLAHNPQIYKRFHSLTTDTASGKVLNL